MRPAPTRRHVPAWRWVAPLFLAVVAALGLWVAYGSDWWVVRAVEVEVVAPETTKPWAERIAQPREVQQVSGLRVGDRVATLDRAEAGEKVAALPGVQEVGVGRGLSGTVPVSVTLDEVVAVCEVKGALWLLAPDGSVVLERPVAQGLVEAEGLPVVELAPGVPDSQAGEALSQALPTLALLSDDVRGTVRTYLASESGLSTEIPDSHVVQWGRVTDREDLAEREASVRAILERQPPAPGSVIDASQRGSIVVHGG